MTVLLHTHCFYSNNNRYRAVIFMSHKNVQSTIFYRTMMRRILVNVFCPTNSRSYGHFIAYPNKQKLSNMRNVIQRDY